MKKRLFLIISLLIALATSHPSFALTSSPSAEIKVESKYILAYPGILPDNPLYKLKVLRDKLIPIFISNPQKKIEFYLLQTNKGIAATAALVTKGNVKLAKETALKAEHNYTLLTYEVKKNKWKIDSNYYATLEEAALKHQEVLNGIIEKVPSADQETFKTVLYFSQRNLAEIRNTNEETKL